MQARCGAVVINPGPVFEARNCYFYGSPDRESIQTRLYGPLRIKKTKNEGAEEEEEEEERPFDTSHCADHWPYPDRDRWCDHRPNTFFARRAGSIFAQVRNTFFCQLVIRLCGYLKWMASHPSHGTRLSLRRRALNRSADLEPRWCFLVIPVRSNGDIISFH